MSSRGGYSVGSRLLHVLQQKAHQGLADHCPQNRSLRRFFIGDVRNIFMFPIWPLSYLIFVIFFTRAKFLENKIFTEKRQFFALNL